MPIRKVTFFLVKILPSELDRNQKQAREKIFIYLMYQQIDLKKQTSTFNMFIKEYANK